MARYLFDEVLGWEEHSKVGEIYDIACFDDENFPIIIVETKWGVELSHEIKEKLRRRIEELGSVKYGVFASERDFIAYEYGDYKLKEITKINVAEAIGVARGEYELSGKGKNRVLKLELLKRERLVWIEDPEYFEKTYKEISLTKVEGVKHLTENLKNIADDVTTVLMNFFDSYLKRKDHYSGRFLENTFYDWLKISMKDEEFKKGDKTQIRSIIQVFCRETAYVLLGRVLFTRMCEDKGIIKTMISGKGIAESLKYYGKRGIEEVYLRLFNESREEIKKYYSHLHELGFFDWWLIEEVKKGTLLYEDKKIQDALEKDLDYSLKKALRRLNRFDFSQVNRDILGDVYQGYLPPEERKRLGEFYTPTEVVEYILDAVGYKPENEIRGKKIIDPACGSGSFLVEATQRFIERYRRIGFKLKNPDDAKQVIDECINSIYGLDIHPFACFIAEMNLLFQLVDLYDVVKQKDKYFELPRLNVYRTDSLMPPGEPIELTEFFDNSRLKMLIEETKGADKVKGMNFDFVVANPPYVTGVAEGGKISRDYKRKLGKIFPDIYTRANDLAVYFLALGIKLLSPSGQFGYIVTGQFMKARYGQYINAYIVLKTAIKQFVDVRDSDVFKEVSNYPILLFLENSEDKGIIKACEVMEDLEGETWNERLRSTIDHIRKNVMKKHFEDKYINCFEFNQKDLLSLVKKEKTTERHVLQHWIIAPAKRMSLLSKIMKASNCLLEDLCEIHEGLHTGLHKKMKGEIFDPFIVREENILKYNLEKELFKASFRTERTS